MGVRWLDERIRMSFLARPAGAALTAKTMQRATTLASRRPSGPGSTADRLARLPEFPRDQRTLTIPTSVAVMPTPPWVST